MYVAIVEHILRSKWIEEVPEAPAQLISDFICPFDGWLVQEAAANGWEIAVQQILLAYSKREDPMNVKSCFEHESPYNPIHFHDFEVAMEKAAAAGYLTILETIYLAHSDLEIVPESFDLAATNGHFEVVKWLLDNAACAGYTEEAIIGAALNGHLEILQWLYEHRHALEFNEQVLLAAARNGHLDIVKWLHSHIHEDPATINVNAAIKDFELVKWLCEHNYQYTNQAMDYASSGGHLDLLKYLQASQGLRGTAEGIIKAASNGHLEVLIWLVEELKEAFEPVLIIESMNAAAANGHVPVLDFFYKKFDHSITPSQVALEKASANGHLSALIWLQTNFPELEYVPVEPSSDKLTPMDQAAAGGHLAVLEFFRTTRADTICTYNAINLAASNGHLEVLKWLHIHFGMEGCTLAAMDNAASNGHLDIVQWLALNRTEGCSSAAVCNAALNGHLSTVQWLCEHYPDECSDLLGESFDPPQVWTSQILRVARWLETLRQETQVFDMEEIASTLAVVPYMDHEDDKVEEELYLYYTAGTGLEDLESKTGLKEIIEPIRSIWQGERNISRLNCITGGHLEPNASEFISLVLQKALGYDDQVIKQQHHLSEDVQELLINILAIITLVRGEPNASIVWKYFECGQGIQDIERFDEICIEKAIQKLWRGETDVDTLVQSQLNLTGMNNQSISMLERIVQVYNQKKEDMEYEVDTLDTLIEEMIYDLILVPSNVLIHLPSSFHSSYLSTYFNQSEGEIEFFVDADHGEGSPHLQLVLIEESIQYIEMSIVNGSNADSCTFRDSKRKKSDTIQVPL